jgi:hypothetical protein
MMIYPVERSSWQHVKSTGVSRINFRFPALEQQPIARPIHAAIVSGDSV